MRAESILAYDLSTFETQLLTLLRDGFRPTFGIVFCSPAQDFQSIMSLFKQYQIDLAGCTAAGEIVNEALYESSIACTLMDLNRDYYQLGMIAPTTSDDDENTVARKARAFADDRFENVAMIVLSSGIHNDGEKIISGLRSGVKHNIPIFGGMAGDDLNMIHSFIFTTERQLNNGLLVIALDTDKIEIKGLATSGWQAIGASNTITKAQGNLIETINHQPALDFFLKFFGSFDSVSDSKGQNISTMSAQYPFQLQRNTETTVLRVPLTVSEKDRTIRLTGSVNNGDKFRFSISPGTEVAEQTVLEFEGFKNQNEVPDALLLFSCKGRHAALGPYLEDEIAGIYEHWNKPMLGFLSYGEFGNLKNGVCEFHNETCCLVTLRVK
ncbi:MAG: hypothetical protein RLZZ628_3652 [Bacteroidota bacterium]|jgi:hypothetical protein